MAGRNLIPVTLAGICGIATAVAVWQPEFQKIRDERQGTFQQMHPEARGVATTAQENVDTIISDAIISDIKEVAKSLDQPKGFGWAIRDKLFSKSKKDDIIEKATDDRGVAGS